jgi:hypothetical protein
MSRIDEIMSDLREGRDPYFVVGQLEYVARMQEAMIEEYKKDLRSLAETIEGKTERRWTEINIGRPEWTARNSEDFLD